MIAGLVIAVSHRDAAEALGAAGRLAASSTAAAPRTTGFASVSVQAPRGEILDRRGKVLVDNRTVLVLEVQAGRPSALAAQARQGVRRRSAASSGSRRPEIRSRIGETPQIPGLPGGAPAGPGPGPALLPAREPRALSRASASSAATCASTSTARSPLTRSACVGQVSPEQLGEPRYSGVEPGDIVGQAGLEYRYDGYLRGTPGERRIQVDALGRPQGELANLPARPGDSLRLTLDSGLQATGEAALRSSGLPGALRRDGCPHGAVLAMGSHPDLRPGLLRAAADARGVQVTGESGGRPAAQPRRPGRLSNRLGLQADYRHRRSRGGADRARRDRL